MSETANPRQGAANPVTPGRSAHTRSWSGSSPTTPGRAWDLDGPAKDAARFASWLLDRGVPAGQILLFLSPLADQPLGVPLPAGLTSARPAARTRDQAITRTLPGWRGDLLWLFWAGHGVLTRDERLRLFYSDASIAYKRNLELASLLTALRSDRYPGLPRQIGMVDACQTYAERLQLATTLPAETLAYGQPLPGREQFVLYAASPGQVAVNLGTAKAGLFSQTVMEELTGPGGDGWPPAMERVAERLDRRFSELRAAGRATRPPRRSAGARGPAASVSSVKPYPRRCGWRGRSSRLAVRRSAKWSANWWIWMSWPTRSAGPASSASSARDWPRASRTTRRPVRTW